ncbi:MAG TPA: RNA 2',3'-cyclic phosphodiesterase [Terriglobales bacterium]|jgi:2'-5' RNA ligase|nr:RNA 2',3'-cyclic phosphodiesterase [Terriglobales bacterium]
MRLFAAIDLDDPIRQRILRFMEGVRGFAPEVRWVSPASLHITLKFIGESNQLEAIREKLSNIQAPPTQISFRGAGFFPTARSPRVFWVGVEADKHLAELAQKVEKALLPLGVEKEERAFTPHLTLARSGSGAPSRQSSDGQNKKFQHLQEQLAKIPPPDFGTMTAHQFFLYQSKTAPAGAVYTKLTGFELQ